MDFVRGGLHTLNDVKTFPPVIPYGDYQYILSHHGKETNKHNQTCQCITQKRLPFGHKSENFENSSSFFLCNFNKLFSPEIIKNVTSNFFVTWHDDNVEMQQTSSTTYYVILQWPYWKLKLKFTYRRASYKTKGQNHLFLYDKIMKLLPFENNKNKSVMKNSSVKNYWKLEKNLPSVI